MANQDAENLAFLIKIGQVKPETQTKPTEKAEEE
jgi:hypothetical protein